MGHGPAIGGRFWDRRFRRKELSSLLHDLQVFLRPASFVEKKGNSIMSFSFLHLRQILIDIYYIISYVENMGFFIKWVPIKPLPPVINILIYGIVYYFACSGIL